MINPEFKAKLKIIRDERERVAARIREHSPAYLHQAYDVHEHLIEQLFYVYDRALEEATEDNTLVPKLNSPSSKYGGMS